MYNFCITFLWLLKHSINPYGPARWPPHIWYSLYPSIYHQTILTPTHYPNQRKVYHQTYHHLAKPHYTKLPGLNPLPTTHTTSLLFFIWRATTVTDKRRTPVSHAPPHPLVRVANHFSLFCYPFSSNIKLMFVLQWASIYYSYTFLKKYWVLVCYTYILMSHFALYELNLICPFMWYSHRYFRIFERGGWRRLMRRGCGGWGWSRRGRGGGEGEMVDEVMGVRSRKKKKRMGDLSEWVTFFCLCCCHTVRFWLITVYV